MKPNPISPGRRKRISLYLDETFWRCLSLFAIRRHKRLSTWLRELIEAEINKNMTEFNRYKALVEEDNNKK